MLYTQNFIVAITILLMHVSPLPGNKTFKQFPIADNRLHSETADKKLSQHGITDLMIAAHKGDIIALRMLICRGAKVNAETEWSQPHAGKPALSFALEARNIDAVKELIKAGADVNRYNDLGSVENLHAIPASLCERNIPLLTYAIGRKMSMEFIEALINAKNSDVNKKSLLSSITPLMIAAAIGYNQAAEALLKAGADATIINPVDGKRAIDYAREAGNKQIVKLLQNMR